MIAPKSKSGAFFPKKVCVVYTPLSDGSLGRMSVPAGLTHCARLEYLTELAL